MKGILFKPDMIQAIIEGRKTLTRRVIKPQPLLLPDKTYGGFSKPRYQVGETVYVKEKALYWDGGAAGRSAVVYADDPEIPQLLEDNNRLLITRETTNILEGEPVVGKWQWKSPLFMAEEDARYFITITDVRAGRVQEITIEDVWREGIAQGRFSLEHPKWMIINHFKTLWNSINPKYPWESNPWCFIYTFRLKEAK